MTTIAVPTTAAELEEWLGDRSKMSALFESSGKPKPELGEFLRNYTSAVAKRETEIGQQVREQVAATVADYFREGGAVRNGGKRLDLRDMDLGSLDPTRMQADARVRKAGLYNRKAVGTKVEELIDRDTPYASLFGNVFHGAVTTQERQELLAKLSIKNSFSTSIPDAGGFLVPESLRSQILQLGLEQSIVRSRAMVIPMETQRVSFPAVDSSSNVSSVYGGIVAYWTQEGAAYTESQATFSQVTLESHKLTIYAEVPNELVSDSGIAFEAFLSQILPGAANFYEDDAFLNGTGAAMPAGFLRAACQATVAKESGQAAATIVWENIVKMYARMLPSSLNRAVWVVSPDCFPELATMGLTVGTGGSAVWLPDGTGAPTMTLLGRPVIVTEKAKTLGTKGDISFVDFGYYLIGDRQAMSLESSPHFRFNQDKTAYKLSERIDGRPWLQSAITPKNGGSTLSPVVNLATRA